LKTQTLGSAQHSIDLDFSSDVVWALINDFGDPGRWAGPVVEKVELHGQGIGSERHIWVSGGQKSVERLEAYDDPKMMLQYSIVGKSDFPMTNYIATMSVTPKGKEQCSLEMRCTFIPEGDSESNVKKLITGIYTDALNGIKTILEQG